MPADDSSISTVTTLLAERRKYEGWLAALDQRRATTPDRVFTRVRADYVARLEAVVAELADNTDALEARVGELDERAAALKAEAQSIHDARAEAELRGHVGELAPGDWERAAREADEKLAGLEEERVAIHTELGSIREMLAAARAPTPAAAAPAVDGQPESAPAATPDAPAAAADEPREPETVAPRAAGSEPAVATTGSGEGAAGGDAPLVSPGADERPSGSFDELAFLRDVTGAAPDEAPPPAPAPAAEERPAAPRAPERPVDDTLGLVLPNDAPAITPTRRASVEIPMAANVASNTPIVIKPEAARQGKTLKCTECGSMNYPTEWYCERCGAELSAL